ncbi:pyridoxamine 5'-phosphate oxidase [Candidatus Anaplasma sp. TIGMIC]|uniref:pyridoxamine 5'-phosphate oxidase n=1 Tax=Candidatus Anaplasma sp. TIGMIC TaxID=3020713 RepID=UPI00232F7A57|nr:pyridoxamine 5'-phosphate oxidase [Candidatus Anaplasma sp. TIGMIC]MDB1135369.1 pyridoxamine 5'-phosphate oxidase [Candidatus Anaplasma sp. TIGMIC]
MNICDDPMIIFGSWYEEMLQVEGIKEPAAMVLATCDIESRPSARVVLLKKYSDAGFEFVTNLESRKAQEMAASPYVALVFDWRFMQRQVRVEGVASFVSSAESDAYHASRPRDSQLSAWCSKQSRVLEDRGKFLAEVEIMRQKFEGRDIPRPQYWGGIRVVPHAMEFWTDGKHRLHDRKYYTRNSDGTWKCVVLYP